MSDATELGDLLFQLRSVDTPLKKLKVLAHAWRTVRRLTPRERRDIAAQIGLEEAERLLEQLGMKDGPVTPAALLEAIHDAEQADPVKLRSLLASLRDREARRQLLQQKVAAVGATLASEQTSPGPVPAAPTPPWLPPALTAAPREEASAKQEIEKRAPPLPPTPPPPARQTGPSPSPTQREGAASLPPASTPLPPASSLPWGELYAPAPPRLAAPGPVEVGAPLAGVGTGEPLIIRLLELWRDRERLASLPPAQRLQLAVSFPDGWRRRRAVQGLLSASPGPPTEEAVALLATLSAERDRIWCLNQLRGLAQLGEEEKGQILGLLTSPRGRRRLALRLSAVTMDGKLAQP